MFGVEGIIAGVLANRTVEASASARERARVIQRNERVSEELGPVATEFNEALTQRMEARAKNIDNMELFGLAQNWRVIAEDIDAYEVAFESEEAAVDWLVAEVASHEEVAIDEEAEAALHSLLAEEFANAVSDFRDRIQGDDTLEHRLQADLEIDMLQQLDEIQAAFDQLAARQPYALYDFPDDRDDVLATLLPGEPADFVDRAEVPATPTPDRHFVLGPAGSGKSRIIAERIRRMPADAVSHVLIPEDRMLSPADATALAGESFDGDLLLVWEDVHRIDEGQTNAVLERTLQELEAALDEDQALYTSLEARSGKLHTIPGNLPADFDHDKSLWSEYEPLRVESLDRSQVARVADAMAETLGVKLPADARDRLLQRTADAASAPVYIETALVTAGDALTAADIEQLSHDVEAIWRSQYDALQDDQPAAWRVLAAMKLLYDLNVARFSKLVRAVYIEVLDGDRARFRTAVEALRTRQWLTVVGDDLVARETRYAVHDTQLEPVRVRATDDAAGLSQVLLERTTEAVPDGARASVHFSSALWFYKQNFPRISKDHWSERVALEPESATAHNNFALVLKDEIESPEEAEAHFQKALEIEPDFPQGHHNYAVLLSNDLGRPEAAKAHFERALEAKPDLAAAHHGYGLLLDEEFGRYETAARHYRRALELRPEFAEAHYNLANTLAEELDGPEEAAVHYQRALECDPSDENIRSDFEDTLVLNNYALTLVELGRFEEAETQYQRAIERGTDDVKAHVNYANLLARHLNRHAEAAEHYQRAIDLEPEDVAPHVNYGILLDDALERPSEAAAQYQRALELDPDDAQTHYRYAVLLAREFGQPEDAEVHYQRALELDPEFADAHSRYAILLAEKGDYEAAASHYERALELNPDDALAHFNYAVLLASEFGRPEEADAHYEQAIETNPNSARAHYNRAVLLKTDLERPEAAESHYQRAIELDPDYIEAHRNYALLLYEELDRLDEARSHLETVVELRRDAGKLEAALDDVRLLVRIADAQHDSEAIVDYCELGLELLEALGRDSGESRLWFESLRMAAAPDSVETAQLYVFALQNLLAANTSVAMALFETVWTRVDAREQGPESHPEVASGVAFAALLRLFEEFDSTYSAAEVSEAIEEQQLDLPEVAVFALLTGHDPDIDAAALRERAEELEHEGDSIPAIEVTSFAKIFEELQR